MYIIFVYRLRRQSHTPMLRSETIPCGGSYTDEATILSKMFSDPAQQTHVPKAKNAEIEMASLATVGRLSCALDDEVAVNDESSLLAPGLVDGFWSPIRDDYQDKDSFLDEGANFRFKLIPTIWQCVKNAFNMPGV